MSETKKKKTGLTARVEVRMTPETKTLILAKAKEAGKSVSDYLRELGETGNVTIKEERADKKLIYELNKIGINLNQILKRFNAIGKPLPENFNQLLETLEKCLKQVLSDYK